MLKSLYIKNYLLIDSLEVNFHAGFSVITGETGAGKSIILGALSLILGQRADSKAVKPSETKCIIEGTFDVSSLNLADFCAERDIDAEDNTLIVRREIWTEGKSRAFINDSPASLTVLKELGERLIDIHSQHQNLLLGKDNFQLQAIDYLSDTAETLEQFRKAYKRFRTNEYKLNELIEKAQTDKNEEEFIRFQYNALTEANLSENEQEELESELSILNHAEEIKSSLYKIYSLLDGAEDSLLSGLKEAWQTAQSLAPIYPDSEELSKRIESVYYELKDLAPDTERKAENIEFSPERLDFVNRRLDTIYTLQQKHRVSSIAELLNICNNLRTRLLASASSDEAIAKLRQTTDKAKSEMLALARQLTEKRQKSAPKIEQTLCQMLADLGMPTVRFECSITPKEFPDSTGGDRIRFLFSANKNIPPQPISGVASGGEMARVMLCIKSLLAQVSNLPTIIFDEIDTGISGEIADKMGRIMQSFGEGKQVIAITHLPQIASKGDHHYFVYKTPEGSQIRTLTLEERTHELAQMLSGSGVSEAAIENAKVMLGSAKK